MRECGSADAWRWAKSSPAGIALIAERLCLAVDVAAVKFASGNQIDDLVREEEILD
jgi:hypothetical protein